MRNQRTSIGPLAPTAGAAAAPGPAGGPPASGLRRGCTRFTRRAVCGLGTALSSAAAAGCGRTEAHGEWQRTVAEASGTVVWMDNTDPATSGLNRVEEAFKRTYPRVRLEKQNVTGDYESAMLASLAAGSAPDVMRVNDNFLLAYKTRSLLAPLDKYVKASGLRREDFYPAVYDFGVYDGRPYAWFHGAATQSVFYNVDLFRRAGVPLPPSKWDQRGWTFDDFLDTARRLTQASASPAVYGASCYDNPANEQTFSINNGSPTGTYSKDGRQFTLADPPGHEAIQWIADLTNRHRVQPSRAAVAEYQGIGRMFRAGALAMHFLNSPQVTALRADAQFEWDVAPVPAKAKRLVEVGVKTYAVASAAKNPDNGWLLLHFSTEEEAARIFVETGYVIPAKRAYAKNFLAANAGKPPRNAALFVESLDSGTFQNHTLDTPGARRLYRGELLNSIWDGQTTAKDALGRVRPQVENLLAGR